MAPAAFSRLAHRLVGAAKLIVQAAVFVQFERLLQVRNGLGVLAQTRQRQAQRGVRRQQSGIGCEGGLEIRHRLLGFFRDAAGCRRR